MPLPDRMRRTRPTNALTKTSTSDWGGRGQTESWVHHTFCHRWGYIFTPHYVCHITNTGLLQRGPGTAWSTRSGRLFPSRLFHRTPIGRVAPFGVVFGLLNLQVIDEHMERGSGYVGVGGLCRPRSMIFSFFLFDSSSPILHIFAWSGRIRGNQIITWSHLAWDVGR